MIKPDFSPLWNQSWTVNLGTDIFCSGTVAAAMESTLENVPSMAISVTSFQWRNYEFAGEIAMNIAEQAIKSNWPNSLFY